MATTVVPMPASSGSCSLWAHTRSFAACTAVDQVEDAPGRLGLAGGLELGLHRLHREAGGDLAAGVPAHAVGHDEQTGADEQGVLVDLAHLADVGRATPAQPDARRAGLAARFGHVTSMIVEPIWIRSPWLTTIGADTFRRFR